MQRGPAALIRRVGSGASVAPTRELGGGVAVRVVSAGAARDVVRATDTVGRADVAVVIPKLARRFLSSN